MCASEGGAPPPQFAVPFNYSIQYTLPVRQLAREKFPVPSCLPNNISSNSVTMNTYLLTPWCRVLLEKLTALQLVKKFPAFHGTRKVHYRTHKCPPPVSILGQTNPVHIPISHLLEIRPNFIHPSTPRSPQWALSLRFPHQDPIHPLLLTHTRYMSSPSQSSRRTPEYSHKLG